MEILDSSLRFGMTEGAFGVTWVPFGMAMVPPSPVILRSALGVVIMGSPSPTVILRSDSRLVILRRRFPPLSF